MTNCPGGVVCPASQVCGPNGGCVDPAQLSACKDAADGTSCTIPGVGGGLCVGSICYAARCGDGKVDAGEACDDPDPERCTPNCALPTCGDGFVQVGEACDDGAANADDRACTTRCLAAMCGDGFVYAGHEECDDTLLNIDTQACTSKCLRNTCGDSAVWAGVEPCDDGNTASGDGCRGDCRKVETCGDGVKDTGEGCDDRNINAADGCAACVQTTWAATAILGGNTVATTFDLFSPGALAADPGGNLYVGLGVDRQVDRIDLAAAAVTVAAGTGTVGFSGDGGPATSAQIRFAGGLAVDGLGNLYIADTDDNRVRKVDARTGDITTIAGNGLFSGAAGDNGPATMAVVANPIAIAVSGLGDVYVSDYNCHIRRIDHATGNIFTVAGTVCGAAAGDGDFATNAVFGSSIQAIVVDASENLWIADYSNGRVRLVDSATGHVTTPANLSSLVLPTGLALASGNLWIAESNAHRIVRYTIASTTLTPVAGTGVAGFSGDNGPATSAQISYPFRLARCGTAVCFTDSGNARVRRVTDAGIISTVAGTGATSRDQSATTTTIDGYRVAIRSTGELYFAETGRIRYRDAFGVVRTFAGSGFIGYAGDGGPASAARFSTQLDIAFDASNNLYVADTANCVVRKIAASTGVITRFAGDDTGGAHCFVGATTDGGQATAARLGSVPAVAVDSAGNVYVATPEYHRVRRIDASSGLITTVAGDGTQGANGDGDLATLAQLDEPYGLAFDSSDNLFIADRLGNRVRRVDASTKFITTLAGNGLQGSTGDNGLATSAKLDRPYDVDTDDQGSVYIADYNNHRIRKVSGGNITAVLGTGTPGFLGDGALAKDALSGFPTGVVLRGHAELFALTSGMVRRVDLSTGIVTTVAGKLDPIGMGPIAQARLVDPLAFVATPMFTLVAGGDTGTLQLIRPSEVEVGAGRYPQGAETGALARFRLSTFGAIGGVAYDGGANKIYMVERNNAPFSGNVIHAVTPVDPADETTWTIAPLAGISGVAGFTNGSPLATVQFRDPTGVFVDAAAHVLYVADTGNHVIRAIDVQAGTISTVAGTPQQLGFFGDGGSATSALLYLPRAVTKCGNGDLFIADTGNNRVRRISQGTISTVLGDGVAASSGVGTPATIFPVDEPLGLACDAFGNLFVSSSSTVRMLPANDQGVVDGTGAVQTIYGAAPRTTFPAAVSFCLSGLSVVDADTIRVTDACSGMLIELNRVAQ